METTQRRRGCLARPLHPALGPSAQGPLQSHLAHCMGVIQAPAAARLDRFLRPLCGNTHAQSALRR